MLELLPRKTILKVYCGAMYSGKTKGLINDIKDLERPKLFPYQAFKPLIDKRFGTNQISTRFGMHKDEPILYIPATPISPKKPEDILEYIKVDTKVVAIDEVQFFNQRIIDVIRHLKDERRISVVCATLDLNFRGEPFGPAPALLAYADKVIKGESFCHRKQPDGSECSNIGNRTQRLLHGEPAPYGDPLVYVERDNGNPARTYQLRCEECFVVPEKPSALEAITMSKARYRVT